MDYVLDILDEIALEGLDGITIDGLWVRLEERPEFIFGDRIDEETREFIWNIVRRMRDVSFYRLPEPRKPLVPNNRYIIEAELGIVTEVNPPPEDIYPAALVQDVENNVLGSCSTYKTRKNVTEIVRKLNLRLACSIFGSSLVIVASQETRRQSLVGIHSNPNLEIGPPQYCMLERIGRSRYNGEPTQGKTGLQALRDDPKTIFYYRKVLLKNNFITKQPYQLKYLGTNVSGLLLHLTRFYKLVKPKFVTLTEIVVKFLKEQPDCMVDYNVLRDHLILPGILRRLTKVPDFQKFVRTDVKVPYRTLHPDADIKQWKQKATEKEKKIRVVQLRDPNVELRDVQKRLLGNVDDEEDEDDKVSGILYDKTRFIDLPLLTQCCMAIKNGGRDGVTQTDIGRHLGLNRVQARTVCKNVVKTGAVGCFMTDIGRQRVSKFYLKHFDVLNTNMDAYIEEQVSELASTTEDLKTILLDSKTEMSACNTDDNLLFDSCINNDEQVSTRVLNNEFLTRKIIKADVNCDGFNDSQNATCSKSDSLKNVDEITYFNDSSFNSGNSLESINNECGSPTLNSCDANKIDKDTSSDEIEKAENLNGSLLDDSLKTSVNKSGKKNNVSTMNKKRKLESSDVNGKELDVSVHSKKQKLNSVNVNEEISGPVKNSRRKRKLSNHNEKELDILRNNKKRTLTANEVDVTSSKDDVTNSKTTTFCHSELTKLIQKGVTNSENINNGGVTNSENINNETNLECQNNKNSENEGSVNDLNCSHAENGINNADKSINGGSETSQQSKSEKEKYSDKIPIDIEVSDDFQWLLTEDQYKKEINRLKQNNQIACKSLKTYRLLKRSNLILETVNSVGVINDMRKLVLIINEAEYREGEACRMDKKSLLRILFRLALDKHIKIYRVMMKSGTNVKYLDFICNNKVQPDDPAIKSATEFARLKFQCSLASHGSLVTQRNANSNNMSDKNGPLKRVQDYESRKMAAFYPKFNRMKVIHRFLFYLVYNYEGNVEQDQEAAKMNLRGECELTDDVTSLMSFVYYPKADWKMFIPPLPMCAKESKSVGWSMLSDVLVRLPLSLFTQLVHVPYYCPDVDIFLDHPIKRHFLVSKLPLKMRNCLTAGRKYIFTIFETMTRLAYVGLLQFGPHQNKEKEQVFAFVNRNATLLDTTLSKPGYNKISTDIEYPVKKYRFNSILDIDDYWINAMNICMNTRLGGRCHVVGTDVILENIQDKEDMIKAMKPRDFPEALLLDNGYTPGDKLGAAGFDSALYAHLKRNWHSKPVKTVIEKKPLKKISLSLQNASDKLSSDKVSNSNNNSSHAQIQRQQRVYNNLIKRKRTTSNPSTSSLPRKISIIKQTRVKPVKASVKIRHIKPKKSAVRRPYYDQIDKEALKQMSKLRVDWSQEEDRVLLICKIASAFICPDTRKQINANMFLAFREVLHKTIQSSKNKTSRACQRRVAYMLRSQSTSHNVNLCIEELRQDEDIMEKYGGTVEYIQNEANIRGKKIKELESLWKNRFKDLVLHLMERYNYDVNNLSLNMGNRLSDNFVLPDNLKYFNESYNLFSLEKSYFKTKGTFKPVSNVTDIYSAVLNVTIHSTLCCNSDKTSWAYHLFSIYQQYPEKLLRNVLNKLRGTQMVSFKKAYQANRSYAANYLPLSASPYQLSITYINLMQTRYQSEMYFDCYKFFCDMMAGLKQKAVADGKGFKVLSLTGGSTAAIIQLYLDSSLEFSIDIPDQIIVLDPNVKTKDETYARLVQRYQDILSSYKKDLTSSVLFQKDYYDHAGVEDSCLESNTSSQENDNEQNSSQESNALQNVVAKAASRIALYLMRDDLKSGSGMVPREMDHAHDFFVVNSCNIHVKFKDSSIFSGGKFNDSNIINHDEIKNILETVRKSAIFNDLSQSFKEDINNLNEILNDNFSGFEIELAESILNRMKIEKELGLKSSELINHFGNSFEVINVMNKLIKLSLVLYTGDVYTRYVHYLHVRPWLLHSYRNVRVEKDGRVPISKMQSLKFKHSDEPRKENCMVKECDKNLTEKNPSENSNINTDLGQPSTSKQSNSLYFDNSSDSSKGHVSEHVDNLGNRWGVHDEDYQKLIKHNMSHPIKVVMRPWIRVDGTLNRRVLDMILTSVLSHIMLHPGISLLNVQNRFSPAYLPHHIYEVCDILLKLKCIKRYRITTVGKPSLLSKPCPVLIDEKPTGLESESEIRLDAEKFAIINLGKLLETKPYTEDFIKSLLGR